MKKSHPLGFGQTFLHSFLYFIFLKIPINTKTLKRSPFSLETLEGKNFFGIIFKYAKVTFSGSSLQEKLSFY